MLVRGKSGENLRTWEIGCPTMLKTNIVRAATCPNHFSIVAHLQRGYTSTPMEGSKKDTRLSFKCLF